MSAEVETQGTILSRGDAASPEAFTEVPNVFSINPAGLSRSLIDVTNFDSTRREYKLAIPDGQEIQCQANYKPTSTQHSGLRSDLDAGTARNFKITLADSPATVIAFTALVMTWSTEMGLDNVVKLNFALKPTGALTVTNG